MLLTDSISAELRTPLPASYSNIHRFVRMFGITMQAQSILI